MEAKGKPNAMYGYGKRLSKVFLFLVNLGFQAYIMGLKVDYRNFVLGVTVYGIRDVQEPARPAVLIARFTHQLHDLEANRDNLDVKNRIIHCI
jgi:hypothetical protein